MGGGINNINVVGSNIGQNLGGNVELPGGGSDTGSDPGSDTETPEGPFPNFDYSAYGQAGYGMKDVYALLDQGATGADIRALGARAKDQGLNVGRRAKQLLNRSLSEDYEDKFGGGKFKFAEYGQPGFGMKDIDYVLDEGGTLADIRRLSYEARDKGLNIGPRAQALLEQNFGQKENPEPKSDKPDFAKFADYDFGSQGQCGNGFGGGNEYPNAAHSYAASGCCGNVCCGASSVCCTAPAVQPNPCGARGAGGSTRKAARICRA